MLCDRNSQEEDRNSQMTCLTCLTSHEAHYFYRFQLSNHFYIFYNFFFYFGFYILSIRIWSDFPSFFVLGFGVIFRHSVIPPFRHSTILSFHVLGSPVPETIMGCYCQNILLPDTKNSKGTREQRRWLSLSKTSVTWPKVREASQSNTVIPFQFQCSVQVLV